MNVIYCTAEKPWGVHATIRDHQCTRCGWEAEKPIAAADAATAIEPWMVIAGGLATGSQAAAA